MIAPFFRLLNRLAGRLVCHYVGSHSPDWTWAHATGSRPVCKTCGRVL